jgi:hypothetical protein
MELFSDKHGGGVVENQPKTAAERILKNRYFLSELRRKLIQRQPGNTTFARIVENLPDDVLVKQWLAQRPQARKPEPKAKSPVVTLI